MEKTIKIVEPILKDEASQDLKLDRIFDSVSKTDASNLDNNDINYFVIFVRQPFRTDLLLNEIPDDIYSLMEKGTIKLLIMMPTEQWDLFETFKDFESCPYNAFIKNFKDRGVLEENITWVIPDHNHLQQIDFLKTKGIDVKCNFIQYNSMMELMSNAAKRYTINDHTISKHFSCLCRGRPRHNRFGMMYELWRNALLSKGNVSCEKYQDITQTKGFHWIDDEVTTESFMSNFDEWTSNKDAFIKMLPLEYDNNQNGHWIRAPQYDESELFESAFVWIACETMHEQDGIFITEKTWKAIAYGKPFLLNGDAGSLEYLRSIGYKTFDQFWDESYDNANSVDKIKMISNIVENLCSKDITEIKDMYNKMLPTLKHNQKMLIENSQHDNLMRTLQNA
tara:strand:+ start:493 stop:1674 length:1182 start_codon:yes stop_codon:yes gene_type:complete